MVKVVEKKRVRDALSGQHEGKKDAFLLDPDKVVLVEDRASALFDERVHKALSEPMVLNIMAIGVHTPITVRRHPETGDIECVMGRRRVLHNREANRRLRAQGLQPRWIPCTVRRGEAADLLDLVVSENEQREADSPLNRARKMQKMIELGRSEQHVATMCGCSVATVKNTLSLLDAPATLRKAVESGQVSVSDAYKLAKLDPAEVAKKVEKLKAEAPREPGKKKSKNSAKAREIVDGKKKGEPKLEATAAESAPAPAASGVSWSDLSQTEPRIRKMLETIESDERINENKRMGALSALRWVLGDEGALSEIMDMQEVG